MPAQRQSQPPHTRVVIGWSWLACRFTHSLLAHSSHPHRLPTRLSETSHDDPSLSPLPLGLSLTHTHTPQVANRLDLTWMQPTRDRFGFSTETVSPHTPAAATAYTVQVRTRTHPLRPPPGSPITPVYHPPYVA